MKKIKIKVFSCVSGYGDGDDLTDQYETWQEENPNCVIEDVRTTSNEKMSLIVIKFVKCV